jgi:hypothetical protein
MAAACYRLGVDMLITIGSVIGTKDRVQTLRLFKPLGNVCG